MKRILIVFCCVCTLVCLFAFPSFATPVNNVIDYEDFITDDDGVGDYRTLTISIPESECSVYAKTSSGQNYFPNVTSGTVSMDNCADPIASIKFCYPGLRYSEPRQYISLENIADGTPLKLYIKYNFKTSFSGTFDLKVFYQVNYYDADFKNIAVLPTEPRRLIYDDLAGGYSGYYVTSDNDSLDYPDGAKYFGISLVAQFSDIKTTSDTSTLSIDFDFSDHNLQLTVPKEKAPPKDFWTDVGDFASSSFEWVSDIVSYIVDRPVLTVLFVAFPVVLFAVYIFKRTFK